MTIFDFTRGKQMWGHALHWHTAREVKPTRLIDRLKDWRDKVYRISVMVHCAYPAVGDQIRWSAQMRTVVGTISKVEPVGDPRDMYTLEVRLPL